jgi:hypothetical protein
VTTARYKSRAEYLIAIRELHQRAQRSGWDLTAAPKYRVARWLRISPHSLDEHNREYGISFDDIRTGNTVGTIASDD